MTRSGTITRRSDSIRRGPLPASDLGGTGPVKSRLDEAIDQYREALRINPGIVAAHRSLSQALLAQGHVSEALAASRNGLDLLSRDHDLRPV